MQEGEPATSLSTNQSSEPATHNAAIRILAVDDDPFILGLIPIISANAGFTEVTPVSSGQLALEALAESQTPYDCLLLDISMPGMDGIELCKHVRSTESYRHTPIIMLTGMRDMKIMDSAFQAGATDYVTKPFDVIELGARLRLVQEACAGDRPKVITRTEEMQNLGLGGGATFGSFDKSELRGPKSLIEQNDLAAHLSQLSPAEAAKTQIFAAKVDHIDTIHTRAEMANYVSTLTEVAFALDSLLAADQTTMAYAGGGTFLIATNDAHSRSPAALETDLNRILVDGSPNAFSSELRAVSVSIGKSVQPRGTKEQRSSSAFGRAVALANSRALWKQGEEKQDSYRLVG